jgi:hypothetical protein
MAGQVIRVGREQFRLVATIYEGQTLHFAAGAVIAVEKHDMRPGGTEFSFQVNSRATRDGRPETIAAMQRSLDDEFMESRVKTNILGLPISIGNAAAMVRNRNVALSYGELAPQIFRSKVRSNPVAWRIWFDRAYYAGAASKPALRAPTGEAAGRLSAQAQTRANASAAAGAASRTQNGEAGGGIAPLHTGALLRLYVLEGSPYRPYGRPFGQGDLIGVERPWYVRAGQALGVMR